MCLLGLILCPGADVPLLLVHNRDEFFDREALIPDLNNGAGIVAPVDVRSGGTWFGVSRATGLTVALTNASRRWPTPPGYRSRGSLVADVLAGRLPSLQPARMFAACAAAGGAAALVALGAPIAGFSLIIASHASGAPPEAYYVTNRPTKTFIDAMQLPADRAGLILSVDAGGLCELSADAAIVMPVAPGVHALSNSSLDDVRWAKVSWLRERLAELTHAPHPPVGASVGLDDEDDSDSLTCGASAADMRTLRALLAEVVPVLTHSAPLDSASCMPDVSWSPLSPELERHLQDHAFVPPLGDIRYGTREIAITVRVRGTTFFVFRAFDGEEAEAAPPAKPPASASACTVELGGRPWLVVRC